MLQLHLFGVEPGLPLGGEQARLGYASARLSQVIGVPVHEDRVQDLLLVALIDPVELELLLLAELWRPKEERVLLPIADPALLSAVFRNLPLTGSRDL